MRHLLSHQAGLPAFPEDALQVEYDDRDGARRPPRRSTPVHPPGAGVAEHALTYGHLLDEVLRRATGEPLVDRFARIAAAAGWDLHLRVDPPTWPGWQPWWIPPGGGARTTSKTDGGAPRSVGHPGCSTWRC